MSKVFYNDNILFSMKSGNNPTTISLDLSWKVKLFSFSSLQNSLIEYILVEFKYIDPKVKQLKIIQTNERFEL